LFYKGTYLVTAWQFMPVIQVTWVVESRRIAVNVQPREKVSEIHLNQQAGVVGHSCSLSYVGGICGRIDVKSWLKYIKTFHSHADT
jgi:hypothetical protein